MKFNSQICTSVEQSKHLLELGLKPETADMHITNMSTKGISYTDNWQIGTTSYKEAVHFWYEKGLKFEDIAWEIIPAWSLHRLLEMICNKECAKHYYFYFSIDYDSMKDVYDSIIEVIERHIKDKFFNKEYLKQ